MPDAGRNPKLLIDLKLFELRHEYNFFLLQAVEKHLKGLIVERCGTFPPRTHDLAKLTHNAKITPDDSEELFLRTLTKYYIGTRYPEEVRTLADEATRELSTRLLAQTKDFLRWLETLPK